MIIPFIFSSPAPKCNCCNQGYIPIRSLPPEIKTLREIKIGDKIITRTDDLETDSYTFRCGNKKVIVCVVDSMEEFRARVIDMLIK